MDHLGLITTPQKRQHSTRLERAFWQRVPVDGGGIYLPIAKLGDSVKQGQLLGTITDPVSDVVHRIQARDSGIVIGMALPQIVLSGYGLFHIGVMAGR
jgi:predicted deacylase